MASAPLQPEPSDASQPLDPGSPAAKRAIPVARPVAKPRAVAKPRSGSAPPPPAPVRSADESERLTGIAITTDDAPRTSIVAESPSWLTSVAFHFLVLLVMALWSLPELPAITEALLLAEPSDNDSDTFEELPDVLLDPTVLEEPVEFELQPDTDLLAEEVSFSTFADATAAPSFTQLSDLALEAAAPTTPTDFSGFDGKGTSGRGRAARAALVRRHGGSRASEQAVADALNWLADHQNPDGSWSLVHDRSECAGRCPDPSRLADTPGGFANSLRSGTGLALLPFLGAGQTHKQGRHRKTVARGLDALISMAKKEKLGASWRDSGNLYAHGIAAIVLTEAYGLTRDKSLLGPAQAAVDFIAYAQDPKGGGWRYRPRQPGDTSVTGWQVMALKSALLAGLSVPPATVRGASAFLDAAAHNGGARYSYETVAAEPEAKPRNTVSAVGLLCRMYLGWDKENAALNRGVGLLAKAGPSDRDYYFNYYAAQVLFQQTGGRGRLWREWNREMRDLLIEQQSRSGHTKGSWYVDGPHSDRGGRLYMTSLATMSLEVYYRYLPIYQTEAITREFPE